MILFCCASELGPPEDLSAIEVILYYYYYYYYYSRGVPCQHGFMCGCKYWSDYINEINYKMHPITIQFAVRVHMDG